MKTLSILFCVLVGLSACGDSSVEATGDWQIAAGITPGISALGTSEIAQVVGSRITVGRGFHSHFEECDALTLTATPITRDAWFSEAGVHADDAELSRYTDVSAPTFTRWTGLCPASEGSPSYRVELTQTNADTLLYSRDGAIFVAHRIGR